MIRKGRGSKKIIAIKILKNEMKSIIKGKIFFENNNWKINNFFKNLQFFFILFYFLNVGIFKNFFVLLHFFFPFILSFIHLLKLIFIIFFQLFLFSFLHLLIFHPHHLFYFIMLFSWARTIMIFSLVRFWMHHPEYKAYSRK